MNRNLSKLGTQLLAIWKQLRASQRVSVLAATLVVVGGLISLALWSSRTDYGLLYGMATALMALLIGWFASVVFRRD